MGLLDWLAPPAATRHADWVPRSIELAALDARWSVDWQPGATGALHRDRRAQHITLTHRQPLSAVLALQQWLKAEGRRHLPEWLSLVAADTGHRYSAVSIRLQHSRWGSCSSSGRVSLNAKLLLLPPDAVRYVLVHELSHTVQMNHSRAFWDEVARHQPDWREQARAIRLAQRQLPIWVRARIR